MTATRSAVLVAALAALLLVALVGCGGSPDGDAAAPPAVEPVDDVAEHDSACPGPERPSERDLTIQAVIDATPDDRQGAVREMAAKFDLTEAEVLEAYGRALAADLAMRAAGPGRFSCLAARHGFEVIEVSGAAGRLTIFVDSPTLADDELDRFGRHLLELEAPSGVTLQLHVDGVAKIRRDYPIGPPVR